MVSTYKMYIDGKWVNASDNDSFEVLNPANGKLIANVARASRDDVKAAVDAAYTSFQKGQWRDATPAMRAEILWKLATLVEKNLLPLAKLESTNTGKTIKYARDSDFPFIIDNLKFFAGASRTLSGIAATEYSGMGTSFLRREPVGVVASIVPWNYPLYIAVWKLAPALAAGNSVIIKPATYTPLSLLEFTKLVEKVGLPKGVFNVITGSGEILGTELAKNKKIDMISLTGDTSTGKKLMQLASQTVKKLHLELGGKAPMVVLPDANLDQVAKGATVGAFWNAGQDCTAVTRIYVHKKDEKELIKLIIKEMHKIRIGDPSHEKTDMGPLISMRQRDRVENYIKTGMDEGAQILYGGHRPKGKVFENGAYLVPALFRNLKQDMRICQEEIFGPVLAIATYESLDEAIEKANDVDYGLAASVYGKDITTAIKVANKLRFGTVWVNEHGALNSETPHGGFKQSGFGKDLSLTSLEEYTTLKHVYIDQTGLTRKPWHYVVYGDK